MWILLVSSRSVGDERRQGGVKEHRASAAGWSGLVVQTPDVHHNRFFIPFHSFLSSTLISSPLFSQLQKHTSTFCVDQSVRLSLPCA